MELNIFIKDLQSALVKRGVPNDVAEKHVDNLRRSFSTEDLTEINALESTDEIEQLADSISVILNKRKQSTHAVQSVQAEEAQAVTPRPSTSANERRTPKSKEIRSRDIRRTDDDDYFEYIPKEVKTARGMAIFWCSLILLSPVILALLFAFFGTFFAVFAGFSLLIVASVAAVIALVAVGTAVSLIGIIFGITQLFSFVAAGIYEIGLGFIVIGVMLFASILIYNFAIRLLPWVMKQIGRLLKYICEKMKIGFNFVKKECYKL